MKKIISFMLILALGFQCLAKLGLITFYQLNKDYISKELCENKDKPKMHCEGKCFLKKNLDLADKAEQKSKEIIKQVEFPVFIQPVVSENSIPSITLSDTYSEVPALYEYIHSNRLFHPPLV